MFIFCVDEFSSFQWSPDNTKLLYIAEKKLPKSEPFYKQKSLDKKANEKKDRDETIVSIMLFFLFFYFIKHLNYILSLCLHFYYNFNVFVLIL